MGEPLSYSYLHGLWVPALIRFLSFSGTILYEYNYSPSGNNHKEMEGSVEAQCTCF